MSKKFGIFNQLRVVDNKTLKDIDKYDSFVKVLSDFDLLRKINEDKLLRSDLQSMNLDSISRLYSEPDNEKKERLSTTGHQRKKKQTHTEILNTNDVNVMKKYLEQSKSRASKTRTTSTNMLKPSVKKTRPTTSLETSKAKLQSLTAADSNMNLINLSSNAFITSMNTGAGSSKNLKGLSLMSMTGGEQSLAMGQLSGASSLTPTMAYLARRMNTSNNINTDSFTGGDSNHETKAEYRKTVMAFKKKFAEALMNNLNKSTESDRKEVDRRSKMIIRNEKVEQLKKDLNTLKPVDLKKLSDKDKDLFCRKNFIKFKNNGVTKTMLKTPKYKWVGSKYMAIQDYKCRHKDETFSALTDNCDKILKTSEKNKKTKFSHIPDRSKSKLDFIDMQLREICVNGMKSRTAFIYGDKLSGATMEHRKRLNNTLYQLKMNIY
jgi:hypothetical protein